MPSLSPVISPAPHHWPLYIGQLPEHTPSADLFLEEKQPAAAAPQTLADTFSFDIGQFLDEEDEDITSKAKSPISEDLKKKFQDIADRLNSSLDFLVTDCASVRIRFQEIQDQLPDNSTTFFIRPSSLSSISLNSNRPSKDWLIGWNASPLNQPSRPVANKLIQTRPNLIS